MHTPLVHLLGTWDGTNVARLIGSGISAFKAFGLQWLVHIGSMLLPFPPGSVVDLLGTQECKTRLQYIAGLPSSKIIKKIHWGVVHLAFKLAKGFWARRTWWFWWWCWAIRNSQSGSATRMWNFNHLYTEAFPAGEFFEVNEAQFPRRWCAKCAFLLWSSPW